MRAKQLAARKERLRELGLLDASHRCKFCKRDLSESGQVWEGALAPGKFCSEDCLNASIEAAGGAQERA